MSPPPLFAPLLLFVLFLSSSLAERGGLRQRQRQSPAELVDGFIGTSFFQDDSSALGNTVPQVGAPFAHSPFSPDTSTCEEHCVAPYYYHDEKWKGIRKTHWLSGSCVLEYGSLTVIPSVTLDIAEALSYHALNHSAETWSPAYYSVDLTESGVGVEATNDNRAGLLRFNLRDLQSDAKSFYVIVMSFDTEYNQSSVTAISSAEMLLSNPVHRYYQESGHSAGFSGHHSLQFEQQAKSYGVIEGYITGNEIRHANGEKDVVEGVSDRRGPVAAFYEFDREQYEEVVLAAASSFVSREKAKENLVAELSGIAGGDGMFDFNGVVSRVTRKWDRQLSVVDVVDDDERPDFNQTTSTSNLRQFYTALWHSLLLPRMFADHDGEYLSFNGGEELVQGRGADRGGYWYYDDFSMWDTFRATTPLQFLVAPEIAPDLVHSLVAKSEQGGWLPIFPAWNSYTQEMIGDHCVVLLGDAIQKGLLGEEKDLVARAYEAMRRNALEVPPPAEYLHGKGRRAIDIYLKAGFVPLEATIPLAFHSKEQVSRTLEYAFDDYVVAQAARSLGRVDDYDVLMKHSENYRMVIDSEGVGFPRGRHLNLTWSEDEDTFDEDYKYDWLSEGSAYQYAWFVPHQVEELIEMYDGNEEFASKLNTFFEDDHYNHGNEPDHQALFLYAYTKGTQNGAWRIQDRLHSITSSFYTDSPGGLAGNDDAGQISAWYVLTAMGLYQVCPGCGGMSEYVLTTPLFDSTTLTTRNDGDVQSTFTVSAIKSSSSDVYIQSATLNGVDYNCAFLPHQVIASGGSLEFVVGPSPNKSWGNRGRECLGDYFK